MDCVRPRYALGTALPWAQPLSPQPGDTGNTAAVTNPLWEERCVARRRNLPRIKCHPLRLEAASPQQCLFFQRHVQLLGMSSSVVLNNWRGGLAGLQSLHKAYTTRPYLFLFLFFFLAQGSPRKEKEKVSRFPTTTPTSPPPWPLWLLAPPGPAAPLSHLLS